MEYDPGELSRIQYSLEYIDYLNSAKWAQLSRTRRGIDGGTCQMCGAHGEDGNPLQSHHFNYKHDFGNEDVWVDLVTVCERCHKMLHRLMRRQTSADGRRGWRDEYYVPMYNSTNKDEVKGG